MTVLVTGASGVLGSRVVAELSQRGVPHRRAGRGSGDVRLDLITGVGVEEAVDGVEAIVHCASDPARHRQVDVEGTRRLLAAATGHMVYPGIVGCDVVPLPYYGSKLVVERMLESRPHSILRATQFHQLIWDMAARFTRRPIVVVPHDTRYQVLDPAALARRLVDAVEFGPGGRLPDLGGRFAYDIADLTRSYMRANHIHKLLIRVNRRGLVGAALRAGGNLTPSRDETGETWNEFMERMVAGSCER